jgi:hypothetical protein
MLSRRDQYRYCLYLEIYMALYGLKLSMSHRVVYDVLETWSEIRDRYCGSGVVPCREIVPSRVTRKWHSNT